LRKRVGELIVVKDLLIKRLLTQAGVSVLAGLLMSSAVLAEDATADAGDTSEASIGLDGGDQGDGDLGGGDLGDGDLTGTPPDISIDPVDPGDNGGDAGNDGGTVADGDTGGDGGPVADGEEETGDGGTPDVSIDFGLEIDAPVEVTFDLTDPPEPIVDMDPGLPEQSGSGDIGQTSEGNGGETDSHMRRNVK
jgi:hypothetical protein